MPPDKIRLFSRKTPSETFSGKKTDWEYITVLGGIGNGFSAYCFEKEGESYFLSQNNSFFREKQIGDNDYKKMTN